MKEDLSCSTCELECDCTLYLDRLENKNKPTSCESLRIEYLTNGIMKTIGLDTRISSLTQACLWKSSFTPLQMEFFFFWLKFERRGGLILMIVTIIKFIFQEKFSTQSMSWPLWLIKIEFINIRKAFTNIFKEVTGALPCAVDLHCCPTCRFECGCLGTNTFCM